jgi:hypothetical protein
MAHEDAGHYAAKRDAKTAVDGRLAEAIRAETGQGEIGCAQAELISGQLGIDLGEVGAAIDRLEIRIKNCQLGLFGYPKDKFPAGRAVSPAPEVAPALEAAIRSRLVEGRLPCGSAWEIAAGQGLPKMAVAAACENLKIRVKPCQLGAF